MDLEEGESEYGKMVKAGDMKTQKSGNSED